ncbi:MAG TPA: MqnA/MqnD/SBP family protein [Verrucomicrobiae bacterium]|jgi:1,4-dihydroxy-6-naphthoate synthase|nr:MqnA/MqnD/SBP family protein [Verrucomicrobiae bacterium]
MPATQQQTIRFGHSPDPDDAFMFYAFAKNKIPMDGFQVDHVIEDIESLNQRALKAELEVTAVSCHAYAYLADKYAVMRSGGSIGDKYGPIVVAPKGTFPGQPLRGKRIAIPGKLTTAFLVLQLYEKNIVPVFVPFDQIFDAVREGKADMGLIIHEGQLTYKDEGFEKRVDLGEWWHQTTGLPLPLGVDIIRRDLGADIMQRFARLFKKSIQYSLDNRAPALEYAIQYGRGLAEDLNDQFVGMYVNDATVDMGDKGLRGFQTLLDQGYEQRLIPHRIKIDLVG